MKLKNFQTNDLKVMLSSYFFILLTDDFSRILYTSDRAKSDNINRMIRLTVIFKNVFVITVNFRKFVRYNHETLLIKHAKPNQAKYFVRYNRVFVVTMIVITELDIISKLLLIYQSYSSILLINYIKLII